MAKIINLIIDEHLVIDNRVRDRFIALKEARDESTIRKIPVSNIKWPVIKHMDLIDPPK